ncbi:MAG TPA: beta-galactosidase [Verrucomicrobiae bacterium]
MGPPLPYPLSPKGGEGKHALAALLLASCRLAAIAVALVVAVLPASPANLTVRVDGSRGAPRLVVNGKPVRARMFFGGPGSSPVRIEPAARRVDFEFTAEHDSRGTGTLHFRFGQVPGDVYLDDIAVVEVPSGKAVMPMADFENGSDSFSRDWMTWPTGAANTVGDVAVEPAVGAGGTAGLRVRLKQPASGGWPDWHIYHVPTMELLQGHRYRVSFWARAEPARDLAVAVYRPGEPFIRLGGPPGPFEAQIKMAASAGVNFVSFPIEMPWPEPGKAVDWAAVDSACDQVLGANSNALLLPRFGADPPAWWRKANPGEVMTWEDGSRQTQGVVASPLYRKDAAARVFALVEHLESRFGEHMAGYHPCGQNTGEWFYQGTWENRLNGYAPADRIAWRRWLRGRYPTDAALQAGWGDPAAGAAGAEVPAAAERRAAPNGALRSPATEQPLIDFAAFQQETMADLVCELASAARRASQGRKLVVFFYGYLFEFGPVRLGPSTCGHYALRRVLECPDIDVLCSPISYFDRGIGGSAPAMTAAESVALAGKTWLAEDDTRTYLGTGDFPGKVDGAKDLAETRTMLLRNLAEEASRNFATWWMDLGMTGWFNDDRMWDDMRRFAAVDESLLRDPQPYRPQVSAVIDERAMRLTSASAWRLTEPGIYQARRPLARLGAPYGQYLLDDVLRGSVPARLRIFLNAWQLSSGDRKQLAIVTRQGCSVWCYAPGLYDGSRESADSMREVTGFRLVPVSPAKAWATPTDAGRKAGLKTAFGTDGPLAPLFAVTDATTAENLATYPDGSCAVALRKRGAGWSFFVGAPGLTPDLLRVAAVRAGVHLYTDEDCNVYANGRLLALHATRDGALTLDTGRKGPVRDGLSGAPAGSGPSFTLKLKRGETRVFLLGP